MVLAISHVIRYSLCPYQWLFIAGSLTLVPSTLASLMLLLPSLLSCLPSARVLMWACHLWSYIALTLNTDKTVLSLSQPESHIVHVQRVGCTAAAGQWAAGLESQMAVTGVSNCSQLSWDCHYLLLHCWQHLSSWVARAAMNVNDRTLYVLLDRLPDLDFATILARMEP